MYRRSLAVFISVCLVFTGLLLLIRVAEQRCGGLIIQKVALHQNGEGGLEAGAASALFQLPDPAPLAGFPLTFRKVGPASPPLRARAVVFRQGPLKVGIVSLELLYVSESLSARIDERAHRMGLSTVWTTATHSHSAVGGFEPGVLGQWAGAGLFKSAIQDAVVDAAQRALEKALSHQQAVTMSVSNFRLPHLLNSRNDDEPSDDRVERLSFDGPSGREAQLIIFAAHPTLVSRDTQNLDGDFPSRLSQLEEQSGGGISIFLQGAVGNAGVNLEGSEGPARPDRISRIDAFVQQLALSLDAAPSHPIDPLTLEVRNVITSLPKPDSRRFLPRLLTPLGDAVLCLLAPTTATLRTLKLGPLALWGVPGEITGPAAQQIEGESARMVSLVGGYIGYIETPEWVKREEGEAKRQYFKAELLDVARSAFH